MFTGIIEATGILTDLVKQDGNITFTIRSTISDELKIDQSIAHDGVCLTVIAIDAEKQTHAVTAIHETLAKTNLGAWNRGDQINLERCLKLNDRLDGHWVQGHVDQTGKCIKKEDENGSWLFTFEYDATLKNITVEKGSICVNGVSLTVVGSSINSFSVAIIPYTYEHTNFNAIQKSDTVNLEFDILGKYIARYMEISRKS